MQVVSQSNGFDHINKQATQIIMNQPIKLEQQPKDEMPQPPRLLQPLHPDYLYQIEENVTKSVLEKLGRKKRKAKPVPFRQLLLDTEVSERSSSIRQTRRGFHSSTK